MMKKGTICIISGLLLIAAALSLTGYNLWDNHRAGVEAQDILEQLLPKIESDPVPTEGRVRYAQLETQTWTQAERQQAYEGEIEYPDYVLNPNMEMPVKQIDGNDYIGIISIPAIARELPVFNEWSYPNLKTAPCRYTGTAYLDNMVICAHNYDIHFGSLKYLSYGDAVTFTDMDGNVFTYKVTEIETLDPYAIDEMTTGDWDLTLFTCTIGGATRVTVRCEKVST